MYCLYSLTFTYYLNGVFFPKHFEVEKIYFSYQINGILVLYWITIAGLGLH